MSTEIIKVLEYLGDKLGIAIDWTQQNVMPYVENLFKRYVTLKITYAGIEIFFGIILGITAIVMAKKVLKHRLTAKEKKRDTMFWECYCDGSVGLTDAGFAITFTAVIVAVISAVLLGIGIYELVGWIIVPEAALIKEISESTII